MIPFLVPFVGASGGNTPEPERENHMTDYFNKDVSTNNDEKPNEVLAISVEYTKGSSRIKRGIKLRFLQCEVEATPFGTSRSFMMFGDTINQSLHITEMKRKNDKTGIAVAKFVEHNLDDLFIAAMQKNWAIVNSIMAACPQTDKLPIAA